MRILVPLDGSEFSLAAVPVAVGLARAADAEIVLIAVGEVPDTSNDALLIRTELHERVQRARSLIAGVTVHALVEMSDNPAEVIVQAARTQGIAHIAMSTHGRTALAQLLLGSVAAAVVRHSPVPVTLIRPAFEEEQGRQEQPGADA